MSVSVKPVTGPLLLGEGPHYDSGAQVLYSVDVYGGSIHKYDPATGQQTGTKLDGQPSFIIPVEGSTDQFVVGMARKFLVIRWDGLDGGQVEVVKVLGEVDQDVPTTILNDGKVDPRGRLYSGTWHSSNFDKPNEAQKIGSIYCVEGSKIKKVDQGVLLSNGLSWDAKEKAFYYTDSMEYKIRRYDYDIETGEISNLRYIFDLKKNGIEGLPDGHTIDTDGNLWVAVFGSSCVLQVNPRTGKLLRQVPIPAPQVTSVTFGGPNLDVLYVTTASMNMIGEQKPPAGCTFAVTGLGVKGHPNRNFKL